VHSQLKKFPAKDGEDASVLFYSDEENEQGFAACICFVIFTLFWKDAASIFEHCLRCRNAPALDFHGVKNGKWRMNLLDFIQAFGRFVEHYDQILAE
jgi:hypothetical protein